MSFFFPSVFSLGKKRQTWDLDVDQRGVILADMAGKTLVGTEGLFAGWMEADMVLGGLATVRTPLRHGWEREMLFGCRRIL